MSIEEQNRKLVEAAKLIQDFCDNNECDDCPFSVPAKLYHTCRLQDGIPQEWDLVGLAKEVGE